MIFVAPKRQTPRLSCRYSIGLYLILWEIQFFVEIKRYLRAAGWKRGSNEWRMSCLSASHCCFQAQAEEQRYKAASRVRPCVPLSTPSPSLSLYMVKRTIEWKMEDVYLLSLLASLYLGNMLPISFCKVMFMWFSVVNLPFAAKSIFNCFHDSRDLTSSDPARRCSVWLAAKWTSSQAR